MRIRPAVPTAVYRPGDSRGAPIHSVSSRSFPGKPPLQRGLKRNIHSIAASFVLFVLSITVLPLLRVDESFPAHAPLLSSVDNVEDLGVVKNGTNVAAIGGRTSGRGASRGEEEDVDVASQVSIAKSVGTEDRGSTNDDGRADESGTDARSAEAADRDRLCANFEAAVAAANDPVAAYLSARSPGEVCGRSVPLAAPPCAHIPRIRPAVPPTSRRNGTRTAVVGAGKTYGRTNNQMIVTLRAVDVAWEEGLPLIAAGWSGGTAEDGGTGVLGLFRNDSARFRQALGVDLVTAPGDPSSKKSWKQIGKRYGDGGVVLTSAPLLWSRRSTRGLARRRKMMLNLLFSSPTDDTCRNIAEMTIPSGRYVAVHLRGLEGQCATMAGRHHRYLSKLMRSPPTAEENMETCSVTPEFVKSAIVRALGRLDDIPIVVLHDGQGKSLEALGRLRSDPIIGPLVRETAALALPTATGESSRNLGKLAPIVDDMMVGALADTFIGNAMSTLSGNIARARVSLGWDEGTNYVFMRRKQTTVVSSSTTVPGNSSFFWEPCLECLWVRQY